MTRITYVGRHTGVVVVHEDGSSTHVEHGKTVDFPKNVAASLLEQIGEWQEDKPKKAERATKATTPLTRSVPRWAEALDAESGTNAN